MLQQHSLTLTKRNTQVSRKHVDQVAFVGHSEQDVHLTMTPAAAATLVSILLSYDAFKAAHPADAGYDSDFWNNIAVELLAARVLTGGATPDDVVYARRISGEAPAAATGPLAPVVDIGALADELRQNLAQEVTAAPFPGVVSPDGRIQTLQEWVRGEAAQR